MEKLMTVYNKMYRRAGIEVTTKSMEFQECIQDVFTDILERSPNVDDIENYFRRAVAWRFRARNRDESRLDITDNALNDVMVQRPEQVSVDVRKAIVDVLKGIEFEVFTLYAQGFTQDEIADKLDLQGKMAVSRIIKKATDKVLKLGIEHFVDSRYESYQGRKGKSDIKHKEKPELNGSIVRRRFLCIDQYHTPKRQDVAGKETVFLTKDYDGFPAELVRNKELIQLLKNRAECQVKGNANVEMRGYPFVSKELKQGRLAGKTYIGFTCREANCLMVNVA